MAFRFTHGSMRLVDMAVAIGASEAIFNNTGDLYYKLIIEIKTRISEEIRAFVI
jgi:hypothetical protein